MAAILIGFALLTCSLQSAVVTSSVVCGPGRRLELLLSCQETCEHKPPLVCLPRPRCICLSGTMWDEQASRCVLPSDCVYKGEKLAWTETNNVVTITETVQNNIQKATPISASSIIFGDGILSVRTILRLLSSPLTIHQSLMSPIHNLIDGIVNMNIQVLRTAIETIQNNLGNFFYTILKEGLKAIMTVADMNADLVAGIFRRIQDVIYWVTYRLAKFGFNIFEVFNNPIGFFQKRASAIIGGTIQTIGWFAKAISRALTGTFGLEDILELFNLSPVKSILAFIKPFTDRLYLDLFGTLGDISQFVQGVADFFGSPLSIITRDATSAVEVGEILQRENALTTDVTDGATQIMGWIEKASSRILDGSFDLEDMIDLFNLPPIKNFLTLIKPAVDRLNADTFLALNDISDAIENILVSFETPLFGIANRKASFDTDRRSDLYNGPKFSLANLGYANSRTS